MRARKRRSVFNTISAAMLEVAIMGLFVILAQPQLRDALFELINPGSVSATTSTIGSSLPTSPDANNFERTVHAVLNSPVGQAFGKAIEEKLADPNLNQIANVVGLPLPSSVPNSVPSHLPNHLPSTSAQLTSAQLSPSASTGQHVARYAPLEQYESFRVSVPSTSPQTTYAVPTYQPTQLAPNQWNVASATSSSTLPPLNYNSWAPVHSAQTSYRDIYPPPYGTQSQWK